MFNALPTRYRHYEVLKLLGGGGFGVVYLARDTKLRRLVVLKMLHVHLAADPDMVRRFLQEARAMARLDHANIVRVNRVDDDPQRPFFEMEYVEGQTLASYRGSRAIPLQEAMPILRQMAAALDAAHRQGIVHRDVKPDNVLIKPDGTVKFTDFGIIKLLEVTGTIHPSTGGIIGTPGYMAPEQADLSRKHEVGPATDIYALGVMTYQLLTGNLPFEGHPHSVLAAHATQAPPDPRTFNRYLSMRETNVLLKALAKQPSQRYSNAMAFINSLEPPAVPVSGGRSAEPPLVAPSGWQTAPATPTTPPAMSKKMIVGLVVLVLVAIIVGGVLNRIFFTPTPTAPLGIGSTMEGEDGMTLLYVPEGEFLRGSAENDPDAKDHEKPQRSIYLDAFWIDQTEVTNEMFAKFLNEQGNQEEGGTTWLQADANTVLIEESGGRFQPKEGFAKHPAIDVSWFAGRAYCQWAGRQLPTEAQWEKAARGTDGRLYPWGNQAPTCDLLQYAPCAGETKPVGSYAAGASPYGALDMSGNVWEWLADWYDKDYYNNSPERNPQGPETGKDRILRGGSWNTEEEVRRVRAGGRARHYPHFRGAFDGFRCATSP